MKKITDLIFLNIELEQLLKCYWFTFVNKIRFLDFINLCIDVSYTLVLRPGLMCNTTTKSSAT